MSAKTKIVVLHMKNLIFTGVLIGIGILLLIMIFAVYFPNRSASSSPAVSTAAAYNPGVYTASMQLGDTAIDVAVTVDENNINDISFVTLDKSVQTMYPLIKPAMEELAGQIIEKQTTSELTYSDTSQYTSMVLLDTIDEALDKAAR